MNKKKILDCLAKTVFYSLCLGSRVLLGIMTDKNMERGVKAAEKFIEIGDRIMTEDTE